jgi:serine/threonine-protein kinase RsbW
MKSLQLPAVRESLDAIAAFVEEAAAEAGLTSSAAYKLHLAVDEIATNLIIHGYEEAGLNGDVWAHSAVDDRTLTLTIEDTAKPYDPRTRAMPVNLDAPPEEREIGGLGIFLVIRSVDRFDYEYVNGRNRNIFTMNRAGQAGR